MIAFCRLTQLLSGLQRERPWAKWRHALPALAGELELLAGSTEGEFLTLGEKLQNFYQRAEQLSKTCSGVAAHMAGKELATLIEGFRDVLEGVNRLESGSRKNTDNLRSVLDKLAGLNDLADGFHKIILLLRVLCVSIRIESARLDDRESGFDTLAGEVEKLSLQIQNRYLKLVESCQSLSLMIRQTLGKVLGLEAAREKQAGIVLGKTMSCLESLQEKHDLSSKAAENISTHFEAVSRRIGDVVLSMQFHDITRQRIEHARDALAGLVSFDRKENRDPHLVKDVAQLQAAQLKYAGDELVSAVQDILGNLLALADLVEKMAGETSALAGAADRTQHSFLAEMEAGFSSVMSALHTHGEADRELSMAMGSVGGMLEEISAQAGSIESIGEKIKLISLNAIVKACHIGEEGATLGVLAESAHPLSVETRRLTAIVSEALRSIVSASDSLIAAAQTGKNGSTDASTLAAEALESQLQTLRAVNENIVSSLAQVNLDGCALSKDIRKAVDQVGVHRQFHQSLATIVAKLHESGAFLRPKGPEAGPAYGDPRMEALKSAYTMDAERNVHEAIVNGDPEEEQGWDLRELTQGEAGDQESAPQGVEKDQLGDNVELF